MPASNCLDKLANANSKEVVEKHLRRCLGFQLGFRAKTPRNDCKNDNSD